MKRAVISTVSLLTFFSIAMSFLETAVVVYLRELYYPDGFVFPLVAMARELAVVEFWREVATLVMLLGISMITGKTTAQKFAYFIYCFAIWDIFYYIFLKVLLGWPQSLFTWDILFLIPVPWVGPVITPVIVAISMIVLALGILYYNHKGKRAMPTFKEWLFLIAGSLVILLSWTLDYYQYVLTTNPDAGIWTLSGKGELFEAATDYVPQEFNWWLFATGALILLFGIYLFFRRMK